MTELEREFEKKSGSGGIKAGLIVCAVLVVVLAVSSVWLYIRTDTLRARAQNQVDSLEKPQLHMLGNEFIDLFPEPYINCYGIIFNSGINTAYNVTTTWHVYDVHGTLIGTREVTSAHIEGKSSHIVDIDIECTGSPDWVTYEMTWENTL